MTSISGFMAVIKLPETMTEEFMLLIPAQRKQVDSLMSKGKITSYSLSLDRTQLWVSFHVSSFKEVNKILESFPITDFISYEIIELAFHNQVGLQMPVVSLN